MKKYILSILTLFAIFQNSIAQTTWQLGKSLSIQLPNSYKMRSRQGVDYRTFYFSNADSAKSDSSDTFIMLGCCVGTIGKYLKNVKNEDSLSTLVLSKNISWKIYTVDSSYLAETIFEIGDINKAVIGMRSKNRNEIDRLIASYGTLKKK